MKQLKKGPNSHQPSREKREAQVWQLVKTKRFHGVWYNAFSRTVSVRRQMWSEIEYITWREVEAILAEHPAHKVLAAAQKAG